MKTLALFFVTALLLTGSAWAQSAESGIPSSATIVDREPLFAAEKDTPGENSTNELILWRISSSTPVNSTLTESTLTIEGDMSRLEAYKLLGAEAACYGVISGYTTCGSTAYVYVPEFGYRFTYATSASSDGPVATLVLVENAGGTVQ